MNRIVLVIFMLFCIGMSGQTKDELFESGQKKLSQKRYSEAISYYTKAIAIDSRLVKAYINRSNAYLEQNETKKALGDINTVLVIDPGNATAYNNRGKIYQLQGKYKEAIADYNKAISLDGDYFIPYSNKMRAMLATNKNTEAELTVHQLTQEFPNNPQAYIVSASYFELVNDTVSALGELDKAVDMDKTIGSLKERAAFKDRIKDYNGAIHDYSMLIIQDPKEPLFYYGRSNAYYNLKNYNNSISNADKAIALEKSFTDAYRIRAKANEAEGKFRQAVTDYGGLIKLDPLNYTYYYLRAIAEDTLKDKTAACMDMKKAHHLITNKISAEYAVVHNYLFKNCRNLFPKELLRVNDLSNEAVTFVSSGQLDKAIKNYDAIVQLVPDSASVYYERGKLKRQAADDMGAIADYQKALQLNKNFTEAWAGLGVAYQLIEQNENAIHAYGEAIQSNPEYALPYYNIGVLYQAKEDYTKAIQYLEMAVAKDGGYTKAYYELGISYHKIGDNDKACYYFKKAESLGSMPARVKVISVCNP